MSLEVAWIAGVSEVGGDARVAQQAARDLSAHYAEPHRRYHRTSHVDAVLADADWLADAVGLNTTQRAILLLAVCAHDVVYDARPGEDEIASARWAHDQLAAAGVDERTTATVESLVLTTLTHTFEANDAIAMVLSDAALGRSVGRRRRTGRLRRDEIWMVRASR